MNDHVEGSSPARLVVASDVCLYREGLVQSLAEVGEVTVVGSADSSLAAVDSVLQHHPDVLLIDMEMSNSLHAVRRLREAVPGLRVVAFAVARDERDVVVYAEAGVHGYVPRDGSIDQLISVVRHIAQGEVLCSPRVAGEAFRRLSALAAVSSPSADLTILTSREREIVDLLAHGLSNKQIAKRLSIQVATVKNHVHNVLKKLGVSGRGEAARRVRSAWRMRSRSDGRRKQVGTDLDSFLAS